MFSRSFSVKYLTFSLLVLLCGWLPSDLFAAGFYAPGVGGRALSRGGAFVASGEDPSSVWHNPANLSRLKGFHFSFDNGFTLGTQTFKRDKPKNNKSEYPTVHNKGGPYYIPFAAISYDFGFLKLPKKHNLVGTFAFWAPYDVLYDYQSDESRPECTGSNKDSFLCRSKSGPQRYQLIQNIPFQMFFGWSLAYGVRLGPVGVRLGAVFQVVQTRIDQKIAAQVLKGSTISDANDVDISLKGSSPFVPSGSFGLTIDLPAGISIGAAFKTSYPVEVTGTLKVDLSPTLEKMVDLKGDAGALSFEFPWIARFGILYKPTFYPRLEVEAAFVYEAWSVIQGFTLSSPAGDNQISFANPLTGKRENLAPITLPREWQDTWSIRAGAQFAVIPNRLFVRAGWYYETSAVPTNRADVSVIHNERHAITLGIEGRFKAGPLNLAIHAAYSHGFGKTLEVKDSKVAGVVLLPAGEQTEVVGNGVYTYDMDVFLLTFALQF